MVIVLLRTVGISNISFCFGTHRMVSSPMGGDGGMLPFRFWISQERGDVVATDMARFFNASQ